MAAAALASPRAPCKICSAVLSKYQCPRCDRKTCSLQCYRRHKTLYDCNGRRDPAAKLPRAQVATPATYDRDFNFLTGVERAVENVYRSTASGGDGVCSGRPAKDSPFERSLAECNVHIHRAPVGMSRQRNNQTHWMPKRKQVQWTVEWIDPDGTAWLGHCNFKSCPSDEYANAIRSRDPHSRQGIKKRRRSVDSTPDVAASGADVDNVAPDVVSDAPASAPPHHLYLVKPFTKGRDKVLVPLQHGKTLFESLAWQEIFEFPTVQVLVEAPDHLPKGYLLDKHYFENQPRLVAEVESHEDAAADDPGVPSITTEQILETVGKDLAR